MIEKRLLSIDAAIQTCYIDSKVLLLDDKEDSYD